MKPWSVTDWSVTSWTEPTLLGMHGLVTPPGSGCVPSYVASTLPSASLTYT